MIKHSKQRIGWRRLGIGLCLVLAAGAYFAQLRPGVARAAEPARDKAAALPVPVSVEKVVSGDFPVYLGGLGSVVALHTVVVRSRVDGELVRVAFTEGQMVAKGDLLAEIDPRPFRVQLQQAEGQLMHDEALLKNAEIDWARYKTLLEQDSIAAQQAMTQQWLVKQYLGTVETDRAQVANARLQLTYAKVTAPVAGRVGLRLVDQGNIVHASDAAGLAVITQIKPIAVVFTLPEDQIPAVMRHWRAGEAMAVEAYDRAGKAKLAEGKLLAVDNQIDAATGTVKLKAQFPNEDLALFSNQFVNVKLHLETLRGAVLLPNAAVQRGSVGSFVYAVKADQTVAVRPVKLGPVEAERAVVVDGLSLGEAVVVDGADKLREGSKVEVIRKDAKPPPEPAGGKGQSPRRGPAP